MSAFRTSNGGWKCGFLPKEEVALLVTSRMGLSVCTALGYAPVQLALVMPTQNHCVVLSGQQAGGGEWLGR